MKSYKNLFAKQDIDNIAFFSDCFSGVAREVQACASVHNISRRGVLDHYSTVDDGRIFAGVGELYPISRLHQTFDVDTKLMGHAMICIILFRNEPPQRLVHLYKQIRSKRKVVWMFDIVHETVSHLIELFKIQGHSVHYPLAFSFFGSRISEDPEIVIPTAEFLESAIRSVRDK